jgi:hypothetical protein
LFGRKEKSLGRNFFGRGYGIVMVMKWKQEI